MWKVSPIRSGPGLWGTLVDYGTRVTTERHPSSTDAHGLSPVADVIRGHSTKETYIVQEELRGALLSQIDAL